MNCKPGDLAFIIACPMTPQLLGHVVEVVGPWPGAVDTRASGGQHFTWEVRYPDGRKIPACHGFADTGLFLRYVMSDSRPFSDKFLRPIRGGDGVDEIIALVGKPGRLIVTVGTRRS